MQWGTAQPNLYVGTSANNENNNKINNTKKKKSKCASEDGTRATRRRMADSRICDGLDDTNATHRSIRCVKISFSSYQLLGKQYAGSCQLNMGVCANGSTKCRAVCGIGKGSRTACKGIH